MPANPLGEVFGFPVDNMTEEAVNHRRGRLCPFHNSSGINCTKVSAINPLGVCTILEGENLVVTCPVRFREGFQIITDAAEFFFPGRHFVALTEARLKDKNGKSAGNIDIVVAAIDEKGAVLDFGAIEVQAVYITGNVRKVFDKYMEDPQENQNMEWSAKNYPGPDYLSSSRKRLAPQLIFKGGILHHWGKRIAVVVDESFFSQLPVLAEVESGLAEIAWMVYRIEKRGDRFSLRKKYVRYTQFESALASITTSQPGNVDEFVDYLRDRISRGGTMGIPNSSGIAPDIEPPIAPLGK